MKRFWAMALAVGVVASVTAPAGADEGTLPGGTAISVEIGAPTAGATVATGVPLTVSGTAAVGEGVPVADTTIVYLLDVSGSMDSGAGIDCDGDTVADTRLVCEQEAALAVNAAADASETVLNSAVIGFQSTASVATEPELTPVFADVAAAISGLEAGGGTSFQAALTAANGVLASGEAGSRKLIVMISDGENGGSVTGPLTGAPVVQAFAIGGAGCTGLSGVVALGSTGSACTEVSTGNLPGLGGIIGESIGSSLVAVEVSVDGGTPIPATTTPAVPQDGPVSVTFTAQVPAAQLAVGTRTICATAHGTDVGGAGSVQDCVTVVVGGATIDCATVGAFQCNVSVTDPGRADATANGSPGFDKTLTLSAAPSSPTDCGGQPCRTSFLTQFPDLGGTGEVVTLIVTTTRANSTPPARAAVYLDGARITRSCSLIRFLLQREILPCALIYTVSGGRTQYLVRMDGDPMTRFR